MKFDAFVKALTNRTESITLVAESFPDERLLSEILRALSPGHAGDIIVTCAGDNPEAELVWQVNERAEEPFAE